MKKIMALIVIVPLLFPLDAAWAKEREGVKLVVTKIDGTNIEGELIAVRRNSLLLLGSSSGQGEAVPWEDIDTLKIVKKAGLYWGAGLGLVLGAAGGAVLGHQSTNPNNSFYLIEKDVTACVLGGVFGAVAGGITGGGIGYAIGGSRTFQIKGMSQDDVDAVLKKLKSKARISDYQ
jgi:hypothetical protein